MTSAPGGEQEGGAAGRMEQLVRAMREARVLVWEMEGGSGALRFHMAGEEMEEMGFSPRFLPASRAAWLSQIHPGDRERVRAALRRARQRGEPLDVEYRVVLPGARETVHWLTTRGQPTPGEGMIGVTIDVSSRKRAEEAARAGAEALRAVFAASPDLINILDPDGRVRLASPAVAEVLGYDPVQEQETTTLEWVHPQDRARVAEALARVCAGEKPEGLARFRYRRVDGSWRVLESHGRRMLDGEGRPAGVVVVSRDVTERVQMEEELRRAKEAAERSSRAKSVFLSRMSHELRTPLNAVIGFAQLLELDAERPDDREAAAEILRAGRHLLGLIDEVLDAARIEAGRLRVACEWISLDAVVGEALGMIAPLAAARRIAISRGDAPGVEVHADPQRLRQVLLNLLSNAVKFTAPGGRVELGGARLGERARIAVRDTGRGIPAEQMGRLFRPFERLDAEERGIEGTGLGLALSRGLVEAMGGSLVVESRAGEGSTFTVELPARAAPSRAAAVSDAGAPAACETRERFAEMGLRAGDARLLHAEGDLGNLRLVRRLLHGRAGFPLRGVATRGEALRALEEELPTILLLDIDLPDGGGEEVVAALRSLDPGRRVRVLALTDDESPDTRARLLELEVDAYLTRPLEVQELFDALSTLVSGVAA